jgi:O-antigen polymerase
MRIQWQFTLVIAPLFLLFATLLFNNQHAEWPYSGNLLPYSLVLFIIILFVFYYGLSGKSSNLQISRIDLVLFIFGIYILLRVVLDTNASIWNDTSLKYIFAIAVYFFLRRILQEERTTNYVWLTITAMGLLCSIHGLIQYGRNLSNEHTWLAVRGTFSNSAIYSCFIAATLPASFLIAQQKSTHKVVRILAGLNIAAIVFILPGITFSRAAIISSVIAALFILTRSFNLMRHKLIVGIVLLTSLSIFLFFLTVKSDSLQGRLLIWHVSLMMWREAPFTGLGIGQFAYRYNDYQASYFAGNSQSAYTLLASNTYYAFNEYLQILVEGGILALSLALIAIRTVFSTSGDKVGESLKSLTCCRATILTVLVFALFSYPFSSEAICLVVLICLAVLSSQHAKNVFTCEIPKNIKRLSVAILIVSAVTALFYIKKRYAAIKEWEKAYSLIGEERAEEAFEIYKQVSPTLSNHGAFLFNYGAELSEAGKYAESIAILNEAKKHFNHIDLYAFLGKSYEGKGDFKKAEDSYRYASLMIPNRFVPKYRLVKLYVAHGDVDKAITLATEILDMPVKVKSTTVEKIRREMKNFIDSKKGSL